MRKEPDFLAAFKRQGCYVEDLSGEPVNDLDLNDPGRLRARAVRRRQVDLAQ